MGPQLKRSAVLAAVSVFCAGPAIAQGTFSPGAPKSTFGSGAAPKAPAPYQAPKPPSAPKPKTYGVPDAATPKPFKPYEPYKSNNGSSLFGPDGKPKR